MQLDQIQLQIAKYLVLKNLTPTDLLLGERDFRQPELLDFFLKKKKEHKPVWLCNKLPSTWYPTIRSSSVQLMFMDTNGFLHDIKLEAGHAGRLIVHDIKLASTWTNSMCISWTFTISEVSSTLTLVVPPGIEAS